MVRLRHSTRYGRSIGGTLAQLSIHYQKLDDTIHTLNANSNTEWVLVVDPPSINEFPLKKVIGRFCDDLEQELVPQGVRGAAIWWERNKARVRNVPYLYAITVCNEPQGTPEIVNQYMAEWIAICNIKFPSLKTVVCNFSTGTPKPVDAPKYASSIRLADYIGFHEYWVPELWEDRYAWARVDLMWRYKAFMSYLPDYLKDKPIFITECGCDGLTNSLTGKANTETGWVDYYDGDRPSYVKHLHAYRDDLDDRVVAAFVYTAGPWPRWYWYIVDKPLAELLLVGNKKEEVGKLDIRVGMPDGSVKVIDIEEYVKGVVPYEVYTSWPMAALEAQAVAARTYALYSKASSKHPGFDVCATQHCQMYGSVRNSRTNAAVDNTKGVIIVNKITNQPAGAFYSASCGGHTLNTWGAHLKSVACPCGENGKIVNGHRNGLCQWGAYYFATAGKSWQEIINHYYDVKIMLNYGEGDEVVVPVSEETKKLDEIADMYKKVQERIAEWDLLFKQYRAIISK